MRTFGTQGPVNPHDHYTVVRAKETLDFIERIKNGKYIVIFAPRQTGKTTFFRAASDFLYALRYIYLSETFHCPHSVGIVGVKNIRQLNYDDSISPFNIQDEFVVPNFTLEQVEELFAQYTEAVGQPFAAAVFETLHRQTAGQPFLINRAAQILTAELDIPKTETITLEHFSKAYTQLLEEANTHISHLLTNIRRDRRFESVLMRIASYEKGLPFNPDDEIIDELAMYGVISKGTDGMCELANPIYQHRILRVFKPLFNGLETEYFSEENGDDFIDYLTPDGVIEMRALLDNFQDFIARVGFRISQVPDTPLMQPVPSNTTPTQR